MKKHVNRVLIKTIVYGFYQENTGLLVFLFLTIFVNFFYTRVPNQLHLTKEQISQNAFRLAITSVSEPIGIVVFFSICFLYSVKSWKYVAKRLSYPDVKFLFYSTNSLKKAEHIKCWSYVQLIIMIPIVIIVFYAVIIGIIFNYYKIPAVLPVYLVVLVLIGAFRYAAIVDNTEDPYCNVNKNGWLKSWPKPIFSLFLYEITDKQRVVYAVSKLISISSSICIIIIFPTSNSDVRLYGVIGLCTAISHAIILYKSNEFEILYLDFIRNFPRSKWRIFCEYLAQCFLILIPELLWFTFLGKWNKIIPGACLMLSTALLMRMIIAQMSFNTYKYLKLIFVLFIIYLFANLFGLTLLITFVNLSFILIIGIFYKRFGMSDLFS
jgi:hypothetical protein